MRGLFCLLLVLSVFLNIAMFVRRTRRARRRSHAAPVASAQLLVSDADSVDSDQDGIPDHHDFCPAKACTTALCPPEGWKSQRATDFDSDGCADGTEDADKDNDGIMDIADSCPFTPQNYVFVSNSASDFDGDGCADGLEDRDDDNDKIPNFFDRCPSTALGDLSDGSGCSKLQREALAHLAGQGSMNSHPRLSQHIQAEAMEGKHSPLSEWILMIRGAAVEVALGALLSAIFGKALGIRL